MFRHLLVPTDGSRLAAAGVRAGVRLARALGARITLLHVVPPFVAPYSNSAMLLAGLHEQHRKACERTAKAVLATAALEARRAGVPHRTRVTTDIDPWGGILRAASTGRCDAIVMSSRGLGALGGLLLGSQAQRILARARVPVLVVR